MYGLLRELTQRIIRYFRSNLKLVDPLQVSKEFQNCVKIQRVRIMNAKCKGYIVYIHWQLLGNLNL